MMKDIERLPQRKDGTDAHEVEASQRRLLPSGQNKVERISSQTKGLFGDFSSWVELRLKLFQIELQEKVQAKVDESVIKIAPIIAGAIAGMFALVTIALFLGWWLGHPAWGFLVVTAILLLITAVLFARKKRLDREKRIEAAREQAAKSSSNGAAG